jgi:hypothetical protein
MLTKKCKGGTRFLRELNIFLRNIPVHFLLLAISHTRWTTYWGLHPQSLILTSNKSHLTFHLHTEAHFPRTYLGLFQNEKASENLITSIIDRQVKELLGIISVFGDSSNHTTQLTSQSSFFGDLSVIGVCQVKAKDIASWVERTQIWRQSHLSLSSHSITWLHLNVLRLFIQKG